MSGTSHPRLDALERKASGCGPLTVAVAYPCSPDSLSAAVSAARQNVIVPLLVGPRGLIEQCASNAKLDLTGLEFVETEDDGVKASQRAVELVNQGRARAIMKGSQHTNELMGAVVARAANLRTERRISHAFWFDLPSYHKPILITDAVVNIAPDLDTKADILRNVVDLAHRLGMASPKIALLSSVETPTPAIQSSMDCQALVEMANAGKISGAKIDGPLAFDNAFSRAAADIKGIASEVAGDVDVIMVPSLDVGNTLYKSFVYAAGGECAGLVLGAKVPVILTSRADSQRARVASCALARLYVTG